MSKYIVIIDGEYSKQTTLAKLRSDGAYYEPLAKGEIRAIMDIAKKLNEADK